MQLENRILETLVVTSTRLRGQQGEARDVCRTEKEVGWDGRGLSAGPGFTLSSFYARYLFKLLSFILLLFGRRINVILTVVNFVMKLPTTSRFACRGAERSCEQSRKCRK